VQAQARPADERREDGPARGILARVLPVQPHRRRPRALPGQQVEDQRDRDERGEDVGQLQGEVQPGAAGGERADEQRLLPAERLRRGERPDELDDGEEGTGAERDAEHDGNLPAEQPLRQRREAVLLPLDHLKDSNAWLPAPGASGRRPRGHPGGIGWRTRPLWYAMTTSWARSRAPSFTMARLTCVLAVAGLSTRWAAISSLDSPAAMRARVAAGDRRASPRLMTRMAASSSSAWALLPMNPLVPQRSAWNTYSSI